jgi:hypothetical protein
MIPLKRQSGADKSCLDKTGCIDGKLVPFDRLFTHISKWDSAVLLESLGSLATAKTETVLDLSSKCFQRILKVMVFLQRLNIGLPDLALSNPLLMLNLTCS